MVEVERIRWVTLVIGLLVGTAAAQPNPAADAAFEHGRELLQVGKYHAACDAFEDSQRLQPRPETQFNIALCSEQLGKLATALALHHALAADRAKSAELAALLEPRVPRLRVVVAESRARPAGFAVTVNGEPVTNFNDQPIDLGPSDVTATAPGYVTWSGQVTATKEGKLVTVVVSLERDAGSTSHEAAGSRRKTYGVITLAVGGLAVAGGTTFGLLARAAWHDALDTCGGDAVCDDNELAAANQLRDKARMRGNVSTALFIVGGVAVVGGIVLWVTAPKRDQSVAIAPTADATSAGVVVFGRF